MTHTFLCCSGNNSKVQTNQRETKQTIHASAQTYITVVVEALLDHVELPVLSGVISYTSAVKPVAIVAADIVVNLWREILQKNKKGLKCI